MAEYIEREKAFKLIKEQKEKETGAYSKGRNRGLIIAGSIINNKEVLPTADVVEVRHGEWLQTTESFGWNDVECVECSVCHDSWVIDEALCLEDYVTYWHYCPNCGAKMDGGNNG